MNSVDIDIGLARYSDWAFTSSVLVLVGALLLLAVELAYSRGRKTEFTRAAAMPLEDDTAPPRTETH